MGEPRKIYIIEKVGGRNVATNTRGIRRTDQVHRTDDRVPIIHGITRHIRGRMRWSVDGRHRGPGTHSMDLRMDRIGQIVTNSTDKPKIDTVNLRPRYGSLTVGMDGTGSIDGIYPFSITTN